MEGARAWLPLGLGLLAAACGLLFAALIAPHVAVSPVIAHVVAFVVVCAELLAAAYLVPRVSARSGLAILSAAVVLLVALRGHAAAPGPAVGVTLALLSGATVLGALIGARIERPGHLAAVFAISALADVWSVLDPAGPSAKLAAQATSDTARLVLFALPWPLLGTARIHAMVGAGDIVFAALYVAALRRHGLQAMRATVAMGAGLAVGLALLLASGRAVPLLPLMGAAVIGAEPEARSLPVHERRPVLAVVCLVAACLAYRLMR